MKNNRLNIIIAAGLILMVGIARIVNHEMHLFNFAPVCALGLFSGAIIKDKRWAVLLPVLAQLLGDVYISLFTQWPGFYGVEQVCVYTALVLVTLLGSGMGQPKALKVLGYSIGGAMLFFIISNFGTWLNLQFFGKADLYSYGTGLTGFMNTYIAAIPFFKHTLISELAGGILLFGAYYVLQLSLMNKAQKAKI